MPINAVVATRMLAPETEQANWTVGWALEVFESRLGLIRRQLARTPWLAGDSFTAADISVTYALQLAQRTGCFSLGERERAYVVRTSKREAYQRAMESCQATKAWAAEVVERQIA
jgi:glutathione S-transferase